jgi:glycosyltransferase involved in cell wall biosynthesis
MKIGLVTGEYAPMQGGVGDFTREVARAMVALGHAVHVITGRRPQVADVSSQDSGQDGGQDGGIQVERVIDGWSWRCWRALSDESKRLGLQVVNLQFQTAAYNMHPAINLLPLARRIHPLIRWPRLLPIVVTFHDLRAPYLFPKAGPLRRQVVLALARHADAAIVTNQEDALDLQSALSHALPAIRHPPSAIRQIPIGSNIAPCLPKGYNRDEWRSRYGVRPDEMLVGYFGFFHPLKGGESLIRALAELVAEGRAVRLLHIGGRSGSSDADTNAAYAARVESLARELGVADRMAATGFVTPEQVTASLYATDVVALPYVEGASFRHGTFHAALAHGRAIVTTRPPVPLAELCDGENVLLVSPGDSHALADGIRRTMQDTALRARLEHGATDLSQLFTWDRIAAQTVRVFEQAIGRQQ